MTIVACAVCGVEVPMRARQKYCSPKCKDRGKPSANWQGRENGKAAHGSTSRYHYGCRCPECREAQRLAVANYAAKVKAERGISPSALYKRRAAGQPDESLTCSKCDAQLGYSRFGKGHKPLCMKCRNNFRVPAKLRAAIYRRDSLICHLCQGSCDPTVDRYADDYPTLDHIIPRSMGGPDTAENLATAHRGCNVRRGDTPLAEWLAQAA